MSNIFSMMYIFLHDYLSPFLFAIGLMYFIYGCIEYFIIGEGGDEERAHHGRLLLLKSISWFVMSLFVYFAIVFLGWVGTLASTTTSTINSGGTGAGVNVNRDANVLEVPNVPRREDENSY